MRDPKRIQQGVAWRTKRGEKECGEEKATGREVGRGQSINDSFLLSLLFLCLGCSYIVQASL